MPSKRRLAGLRAGELAEQLRVFADHDLYIGGLEFFRVKVRGPKLLAIEFNEQVYRDSKGKLIAEDVE
jgi:hypothetical protein